MTTYKVTYEIDVDAGSHREAAEIVHGWLLDPSSMAPIFEVQEWTVEENDKLSDPVFIDLFEEN
jgi:hypothetical protein